MMRYEVMVVEQMADGTQNLRLVAEVNSYEAVQAVQRLFAGANVVSYLSVPF